MKRKGFTLIELIVVMAIISILVLLGTPKYKEYTKQAEITKLIVEAKELEKASQQYYMRHNDWPRLIDIPYTAKEITDFGEKILDKTGKVVELDVDGKYYDIDYAKLSNYISKPKNSENYILQNPVGVVYAIEGVTKAGKERIDFNEGSTPSTANPILTEVPDGYIAITNREELEKIGVDVAYPSTSSYILMGNIDLSGKEWVSLPNFSGVFDGNGLEINNLTINQPTLDNLGLFSQSTKAKISNLTLKNINIAGKSYVGGLVGRAYSLTTIERVKVEGNITGYMYVGGILGSCSDGANQNNHSNIKETVFKGYLETVSSLAYGGGILGNGNCIDLTNCYVLGTIKGRNDTTPIAGKNNYGGIDAYNCYAFVDYQWLGNGRNGKISDFNSYINTTSTTTIWTNFIGLSVEEMKIKTYYNTWNFETIWEIEEGISTPTLRWENR